MRKYAVLAVGLAAIAAPVQSATVIIYQDPMTMDRRVVVRDTPGPDRAFFCVLPPSDIGCRQLPVKRGR